MDATREEVTDADLDDRLTKLAERLRTQADRKATPALGSLDRIQLALQEIAATTDDETVRTGLETAREEIFSFLGTLEDRGMKQHGWDPDTNSQGDEENDGR